MLKRLWIRFKLWLGLAHIESLEIEYHDDADYDDVMEEAIRLRKELGIPVKVTKGKDYET